MHPSASEKASKFLYNQGLIGICCSLASVVARWDPDLDMVRPLVVWYQLAVEKLPVPYYVSDRFEDPQSQA